MPSWLIAILTILGDVETAAPIVGNVLQGLGSFISSEFASLFGASAAQELGNVVNSAENIVTVVGNDLPGAVAFVKNTYTSLEDLIAKEPWLAQLLYSTNEVQGVAAAKTGKPAPLSRGTLNKVVEAAHANVTIKKASAAKKS